MFEISNALCFYVRALLLLSGGDEYSVFYSNDVQMPWPVLMDGLFFGR